ncbi:MAG: hypothetical protein ACK5MQ_06505 [Pikeienuella sp.]
MIRFAMIIVAILSLGLAPYAAAAHGAGMAAMQIGARIAVDQGAAHDMGAAMDPTAPCGQQGDCAMGGPVCASVCAGLTAIDPGAPLMAAAPPRKLPAPLSIPLRKGAAPPLGERPPKTRLL